MFGGGGDVAADGGEALGAVEAAELAGDLGLELDHAEVSFGLVVVALTRTWTPNRGMLIQPAILLAAPLIGIATGTLAGLPPALKAARTPPAETLCS